MNFKRFTLLLAATTLMSSNLLPISQSAVAQSTEGFASTLAAPEQTLLAQSTPSIVRQGDSSDQAGTVSEIAATLANERSRSIVTAVRTADARLKLINWNLNSDGSLTRLGDSGNQAGETTHIDIAGTDSLVTASRADNGNLKLISWGINGEGDLLRRGDSGDHAGNVSLVNIVQMYPHTYVTAVRDGEGKLKLISWRLNGDGSLTRLADSGNVAGAVSEISFTKMSYLGRPLLATAVRDGQGQLKLISWSVSEGSGTINRLGDSGGQAGAARMIRAVSSGDHVVTSLRAGDGHLKLITWKPELQGDQLNFVRMADTSDQAGPIGDNSLVSRRGGVVSAVRTESGRLKLIRWRMSSSGGITRMSNSGNTAGEASLITVVASGSAGNAPLVTAVKTEGDRLKLISWDD